MLEVSIGQSALQSTLQSPSTTLMWADTNQVRYLNINDYIRLCRFPSFNPVGRIGTRSIQWFPVADHLVQ